MANNLSAGSEALTFQINGDNDSALAALKEVTLSLKTLTEEFSKVQKKVSEPVKTNLGKETIIFLTDAGKFAEKMPDRFKGFLDLTKTLKNNFSDTLNLIQRIAVPVAGLSIGAGLGAAFLGSRYGSDIAFMKAITGADSGEIAQVEAKMRAVGDTTKFIRHEIALAATEIMKLGSSPVQSLSQLQDVINLATIGQIGMADAATYVGSVLNSYFNGSVEKAGYVVDLLNAGAQKSAFGVADFAQSLTMVLPPAKQLGIDITEVSALLMTLKQKGIDSSVAANAINSALTNLSTGLVRDKALFAELNKEIGFMDANGKLKPLIQIFEQLQQSGGNLVEKSAKLFGKDYSSELVSIIGAGVDMAKKFQAEMQNVTGTTQRAAADMTGTFDFAISQFAKIGESISIKLFHDTNLDTTFARLINNATESINKAISGIDKDKFAAEVLKFSEKTFVGIVQIGAVFQSTTTFIWNRVSEMKGLLTDMPDWLAWGGILGYMALGKMGQMTVGLIAAGASKVYDAYKQIQSGKSIAELLGDSKIISLNSGLIGIAKGLSLIAGEREQVSRTAIALKMLQETKPELLSQNTLLFWNKWSDKVKKFAEERNIQNLSQKAQEDAYINDLIKKEGLTDKLNEQYEKEVYLWNEANQAAIEKNKLQTEFADSIKGFSPELQKMLTMIKETLGDGLIQNNLTKPIQQAANAVQNLSNLFYPLGNQFHTFASDFANISDKYFRQSGYSLGISNTSRLNLGNYNLPMPNYDNIKISDLGIDTRQPDAIKEKEALNRINAEIVAMNKIELGNIAAAMRDSFSQMFTGQWQAFGNRLEDFSITMTQSYEGWLKQADIQKGTIEAMHNLSASLMQLDRSLVSAALGGGKNVQMGSAIGGLAGSFLGAGLGFGATKLFEMKDTFAKQMTVILTQLFTTVLGDWVGGMIGKLFNATKEKIKTQFGEMEVSGELDILSKRSKEQDLLSLAYERSQQTGESFTDSVDRLNRSLEIAKEKTKNNADAIELTVAYYQKEIDTRNAELDLWKKVSDANLSWEKALQGINLTELQNGGRSLIEIYSEVSENVDKVVVKEEELNRVRQEGMTKILDGIRLDSDFTTNFIRVNADIARTKLTATIDLIKESGEEIRNAISNLTDGIGSIKNSFGSLLQRLSPESLKLKDFESEFSKIEKAFSGGLIGKSAFRTKGVDIFNKMFLEEKIPADIQKILAKANSGKELSKDEIEKLQSSAGVLVPYLEKQTDILDKLYTEGALSQSEYNTKIQEIRDVAKDLMADYVDPLEKLNINLEKLVTSTDNLVKLREGQLKDVDKKGNLFSSSLSFVDKIPGLSDQDKINLISAINAYYQTGAEVDIFKIFKNSLAKHGVSESDLLNGTYNANDLSGVGQNFQDTWFWNTPGTYDNNESWDSAAWGDKPVYKLLSTSSTGNTSPANADTTKSGNVIESLVLNFNISGNNPSADIKKQIQDTVISMFEQNSFNIMGKINTYNSGKTR